ncbi:sugar transferase [Chitinophaga sancti]|uniref:sugar transferase n=1 Tax=Chitinophaga sancti TaxID=1004 RepID=UPI003F79825C
MSGKFYSVYVKRLIDLIVAVIAFVVLFPVFIVMTLLLAIFNGGTPFFFQRRPGKKGKIFKVVKYKTMNDKRDAAGNLLPDAARLTPVGKFVRKTSLDELPQLLNVITGDMSLIGPRPLLPEYLPLYNEEQARRHDVRPGITGWAQVNGRNAISWQQKFSYDVYYVDHISAGLDLKILYLTFAKVAKSEGINGVNVATAERFTGN